MLVIVLMIENYIKLNIFFNFKIYNMDFLDYLEDYIDTKKYYNKLNKMDNTDYKNIINLMNINYTKISNDLDDKYYSVKKINKIYKCDKTQFINIVKEFLDEKYILGIFFTRLIVNYI